MSGSPLLSIIVVGRNDDYLGNYRFRLETSLNFLARNLRTLGRLNDVEIVFVDWNSQGVPLIDDLAVSEDAASILRFVIVTPNDAKRRFMQVPFFTTCAVNTGIRRAHGEFIMLADSDSMMPLPSLEALLRVLDGSLPTNGPRNKLIYPIPRHQIPGTIGARRPNVAAWDRILKRIFASRRREFPGADCLGGFSAGQLMHRDMWMEFGGYSEQLDRAWGWSDNELMLRVTQKYNWMDLSYYGVAAFHIEHNPRAGDNHQRAPDSINPMLLTYDPHPNQADWGLRDFLLEERRCPGRAAPSSAPQWDPISYHIWATFHIAGPLVDDYVGWTQLLHDDGVFDAINTEAVGIAFTLAFFDNPRNAFFFGNVRLPLLTILTKILPGAEFFFLQPWAEGDLSSARTQPQVLGSHLAANNHRGYSRIVSGPSGQGLDALYQSDPDCGPIELAIFERDDLDANFESAFTAVLERLCPGGAVLLIDSRSRMPSETADLQVFLGRIIQSGEKELTTGSQIRTFSQSASEAMRGAAYDFTPRADGGVLLIRKRPVPQAAQIAAE